MVVLHADALAASHGYKCTLSDGFATITQGGGNPSLIKPAGRDTLGLLSGQLSSSHPLALHLFIHLTEALKAGRCAEGEECAGLCEHAADLLVASSPPEGHLLHMPSHCVMRIGRYADVAEASEKAMAMDRRYETAGLSPYLPYHNAASAVAGAALAGQLQRALQGAKWISDTNHEPNVWYHILAHFAQWDAVLSAPRDDESNLPAVAHFALDMAHASARDLEKVTATETKLEEAVQKHLANETGPVMINVLRAQKE